MVPNLKMRSGVNPVEAGGPLPGWVSGSPANLAVSTNVFVTFDLGPDWQQYNYISVTLDQGVVSAAGAMQAHGSDDGVLNSCRLCLAQSGSNGMWYQTIDSTALVATVLRPNGRFVRVLLVNGTTPQGANAAILLAAFTG